MRDFRKALEDEYAPDILNTKQLDTLFNYARERANGIHEIEYEYVATCDFLGIMIKAGNV